MIRVAWAATEVSSRSSDVVAVGVRHALDEPVEVEASKVVGHPARGHESRIDAQQRCEVLAEVSVGEPVGQEAEGDQDA